MSAPEQSSSNFVELVGAIPADAERIAPVDQTQQRGDRRLLLALLALVVLFDLLVYRGTGYTGVALAVLLAPFALLLGTRRPTWGVPSVIISALLSLTAAKLVWEGFELLCAIGLLLLVALAMSLRGAVPYVADLLGCLFQAPFAGVAALFAVRPGYGNSGRVDGLGVFFKVLLPLLLVILFGGIFIVANPDLLEAARARFDWFASEFFPRIGEYLPRRVRSSAGGWWL